MNQEQTQGLIAVLNRAGLLRVLDGQVMVWASALDDIREQDAREAANLLVRTRTSQDRWVVPGDVRAAVSTVRRRRLAALDAKDRYPEPPELPGLGDVAWWRAYHRLLADGETPERARVQALREIGAEVPAAQVSDGGQR